MQNRLRNDYFWNTLGVFLQNAISPLLLIAVTRLNGIYDSGLFSFAFSVAIIFWGFGMWGGRTYQVSDVEHEFSNRSYIATRVVLAAFMIVGAVLFSVINNYDITKTVLILTLVLFKSIESVADSLYGVMQVHGRLSKSGKSLILKAVGGFVAFMFVDILTRDIILASFSIIFVNMLIVLAYDLSVTRGLESIGIAPEKTRYYIRQTLKIMKRTVAVFLVSFLAMFSLNIPRYFVDTYHPEEIGYFGIIAMPLTLIVLVVSFILQPKVIGLTRLYYENKYQEFDRTVRNILIVTVLLGVGILFLTSLIGVVVLEFVFGLPFTNYRWALLILVAGSIANALIAVYINILVIMRRFKAQFYILLLSNILLVILSIVLIKEGGLLSAVSLFATINLLQGILMLVAYKTALRKAYYAKEN